MVSSTAANFAAAMKRIVKGMPYGSQSEVAEKLGVIRQSLLGHKQIQTTQTYAHLSQGHLSKEADRVTFE